MDPTLTARLALAVSLAVALWQLAKHFLDGPRVKVTLTPAQITEYSLRTASTWEGLAAKSQGKGGWPVEGAIIDVENRGRTAVTISDAGLDVGKGNVMQPFLVPGFEATTENRVRLEPFDRVRFIVEVWHVLAPVVDERSGPIRVRGYVRVAGRRRPRRSSRRRAWVVAPRQLMLAPEPLEVGLEAYRAVWRQTRRGILAPLEFLAISVALAIRDPFPLPGPAPTPEQIRGLIRDTQLTVDTNFADLLSLYVSRDLARVYANAAEHPAGIQLWEQQGFLEATPTPDVPDQE